VALAAALRQEGGSRGLSASDASAIDDLAARIRAGRYVAIVADLAAAAAGASGDRGRAEALTLLSLAVNDATRGALVPLRGGGNRAGAEAVATSQTGYPLAIDFSRGYPRYDPWSGRASVLISQGAADVCLVVGAASSVPEPVASLLPRITTLVIGPRASESPLSKGAAVIDTGLPSVHEGGTVLRMDDVPLPVRGRISGPPSTEAITRALCERIVARQDDAHRDVARAFPHGASGRREPFQRRADG
jgi:formylmethanofuran dehydrogenase subunit B